MIGRTVSHYEIVEKLREGDWGAVYRAKDLENGRQVVIKFLPKHVAVGEREKERFNEQADAANSLKNPNIVKVFGIEETEESTLVVSEYVAGSCVLEKEGQLDIDRVIDIATDIANALAAAHARGVVHGALTAENVILTDDGRAKVGEFGLSALLWRPQPSASAGALGVLPYMAPEAAQGAAMDNRTDLWSLGVLLYELITGAPPFVGDYDAALIYEILNTEPGTLQTYRPDVPVGLGVLVSNLLEKNPYRRLSSIGEVLERLKTIHEVPAPGEVAYSLSVLYFENVSPDEESEYVCAGLSEDLITSLSGLSKLNVVSPADVLPFRNRDINTRDLGESLGVDYVLEGTVRKSGNRLRVTAQLTDVQTGFRAWTGRFDRLIEDLFDMKHELVVEVAEALNLSLSDDEKSALAHRPTTDMRAYDFYLRAREFLSRRGRRNAQAAIHMLTNALAIDADLVLAYVGLAEAYSQMYTYYDGRQEWLEKIIEVNKKALKLDPNVVEAQFSLGLVYFHQKEFEKAGETFRRVVKSRSHHYDAFWWLGILSDMKGDFESALDYYQKCTAIKPYSVEPWLYMNMTHRRKGDMNAAKISAKHFLEVGIRKLEVNPNDTVTLSRFAVIYTLFGEREKAYAALTRIMESKPDDGLVLYNCAATYALLGDAEQSLRCLRLALEGGFRNVREWLGTDPDFDALRDLDEFKQLLDEFDGSE